MKNMAVMHAAHIIVVAEIFIIIRRIKGMNERTGGSYHLLFLELRFHQL